MFWHAVFGTVSEIVSEQNKAQSGVASAIEVESASERIDDKIDVLTVLLGACHQLKLRSTPELGQRKGGLSRC